MTTWTALSDSQLQLDKPVTEEMARAGFRDNLQAVVEGDASVPSASRITLQSMDSPYFMAKRTTDYTTVANSGVAFKMPFNTEVYDPDSLYDNATNYRFTPNRAGLYLVTMHVWLTSVPGTAPNFAVPVNVQSLIYKNGSSFVFGIGGPAANNLGNSGGTIYADGQYTSSMVTALVQMNGTTDYLEGWVNGTYLAGGFPKYQGYFHAVGLCQT